MGFNQRAFKQSKCYIFRFRKSNIKTRHLVFGFNSQSVSNLLKFYITSINELNLKKKKKKKKKNENKVTVTNFEIKVIRQKGCK